MERKAMTDLKKWKFKPDRKPLIIRGSRQAGKTWLMKEFGKNDYSQTAYVNFESSKSLNTLFVDDFNEARAIQKRLLEAYENDFSKHAPYDTVPRIRMLWNSIPAQLAKENSKFIYKAVKPGSRAKDYELALSWLIDCGLVHKVTRATKPGIPLKSYEDISAFKLFITDIGLLGAMGDIDVRTLIEGNSIFNEFKGALTEQFVLQQLKGIKDIAIYYWPSEKSKSEIDFLIQHSGKVIPVEVKSEENLQAKSLKTFCGKYSVKNAVRTSMSDFRKEDGITNLPLYAISKITDLQ